MRIEILNPDGTHKEWIDYIGYMIDATDNNPKVFIKVSRDVNEVYYLLTNTTDIEVYQQTNIPYFLMNKLYDILPEPTTEKVKVSEPGDPTP